MTEMREAVYELTDLLENIPVMLGEVESGEVGHFKVSTYENVLDHIWREAQHRGPSVRRYLDSILENHRKRNANLQWAPPLNLTAPLTQSRQ